MIKEQLRSKFTMMDMGPLHWLLGLKIKCDHAQHVISLFQKAFINTIVLCFNLEDARPISTPMEPGLCWLINKCPMTVVEMLQMKNIPYCEAIGWLMYAALGTHPNTSFSITSLSQYVQNLTGRLSNMASYI